MSYAFKGTGTICGTAYTKKLRKVDEDSKVDELDVTGGGDTNKDYEAGFKEYTMSVEALGSAPEVGTEGAVSVVWGDGTTTSWANALVTSVKKSGSVGGVVAYTINVRKIEA